MTHIRLAILCSALCLGGCNTMNDFFSRVDLFKDGALVKLEPKTPAKAPEGIDEEYTGYVHIAESSSTDELLMTLPDITSDTLVLRRSGTDFVTVDAGYVHIADFSATDELLMTLPNMTPDTLVLRPSGTDFVSVSTANTSTARAATTPVGMDMENFIIEMQEPAGAGR